MSVQSWLRSLKARHGYRTASISRAPAGRTAFCPCLEALEERALPSVTFGSVLAIGSGSSSTWGADIAVDAAGNTYVTGNFKGTTDFDPAVVHADGSDILSPLGYSGAFVAKYGPGDTFQWVRQMGGADGAPLVNTDPIDSGSGVAVDASGNVYVTGQFGGHANFGPSITLTSTGSGDAFVTKLDANGNFLWAKSWGGANTLDFGTGIAVDAAGNVLSVGFTATIYSNGWIANGFEVHKYNPTGTALWTDRINDTGGIAESVATDTAGNVYLGGSFAGTVDFNPNASKKNSVSGSTLNGAAVANAGQGINAFVLKLTSTGTFGWVDGFIPQTKNSPNASADVSDLVVDGAGDVFVGGGYGGQVTFNSNSSGVSNLPNVSASDGFVAKLTPGGALAWATPLGGAPVHSVALDTSGAVYATGAFNQIFTPGYGIPAVTGNGKPNLFATKLTAAGAVNWAVTLGGTGLDMGNGIAVDAAGNVYLCGIFSGTVNFNPDPLNPYDLTTGAAYEMFLLELSQSGPLPAAIKVPPAARAPTQPLLPGPTQPILQPPQTTDLDLPSAANVAVFAGEAPGVPTGSAAEDWFFANLTHTGVKQEITNLGAIEFADEFEIMLGS